jgi:hypothetical protein
MNIKASLRKSKETAKMNENYLPYPGYLSAADTRIQDFWREYRQSAAYYGLPAEPGLAHKVRENAGKALIGLGAWIMPRRKPAKLTEAWGNR